MRLPTVSPRQRAALKLMSSALLCILVARMLEPDQVQALAARLSWPVVAGAILLGFVQSLFATVRWWRLLGAMGHDVALWRLWRDMLVSRAFDTILPAAIGGDAVRAVRLQARLGGARVEAWVSIVYERLLGLLSLAMMPLPAFILYPALRETRMLGVIMALALGALAGVLWLDAGVRLMRRASASRAPRLSQALERVDGVLSGPLRRGTVRAEALWWTLISQLTTLLTFPLLGWSLGIERVWEATFGGLPLALIGVTLPISIGGFGVREGLFVLVLGRFEVAPEAALLLSVSWVMTTLVVALAGALIWMVEGRDAAGDAVGEG